MDRKKYFEQLYKELEEIGKDLYDIPDNEGVIASLERMSQFSHEKSRLRYCREFRNSIVHKRVSREFWATPSDEMIKLLEDMIKRLNSVPECKDFAVDINKVYCCSINDLVLPAMNKMREQNYTHVPILENKVVKGVFSENTIFAYLLDNEIISIESNTTFSELEKYLPIEVHTTQTFRFLPWESKVYEAKQLFEETMQDTERIGMIFLTENGLPSEKLRGILTPWDILGIDIII